MCIRITHKVSKWEGECLNMKSVRQAHMRVHHLLKRCLCCKTQSFSFDKTFSIPISFQTIHFFLFPPSYNALENRDFKYYMLISDRQMHVKRLASIQSINACVPATINAANEVLNYVFYRLLSFRSRGHLQRKSLEQEKGKKSPDCHLLQLAH